MKLFASRSHLDLQHNNHASTSDRACQNTDTKAITFCFRFLSSGRYDLKAPETKAATMQHCLRAATQPLDLYTEERARERGRWNTEERDQEPRTEYLIADGLFGHGHCRPCIHITSRACCLHLRVFLTWNKFTSLPLSQAILSDCVCVASSSLILPDCMYVASSSL